MSQPVLDVHKVARLARLDLTEEEAVQFQSQLVKVLDEAVAGFTMPEALANAPRKSADQFLMPRVVEE